MADKKNCLVPASLQFLRAIIDVDCQRVGSAHDGGYVVPVHCVRNAQGLLSFGISNDWSFDEEFKALNPNVVIHAYDHTISSYYFFKEFAKSMIKILLLRSTFKNLKKSMMVWLNFPRFFSGRDICHYKEKVGSSKHPKVANINTIVNRIGITNLFVKIDIEGDEYELVEDLLENEELLIGLVVEFHSTSVCRQDFINAIKKLTQFFTIVHIHGNNFAPVSFDGFPEVVEITMIHSRLLHQYPTSSNISRSHLDAANNPLLRDYVLVFDYNN